MRVPLLSGAYQARSVIAGAQRCINLYPEKAPPNSQQPVPVTHYPTPGTVLLAKSPLVGVSRQIYRATNGELFRIVGTDVYYVDSNWVHTYLGSISNLTTTAYMSDNGLALVIVDGTTTGYAIDLITHAFGTIIDPAFLGATKVDYLDTYFVFNRPGTNQFYISLSNVDFTMLTTGTSFDPLDIAAKTGSPDPIESLIVVHNELVLAGNISSEVWYNSGSADFTLQRMQGAFIDHGTVAKFSLAKQDVFSFWLSQDREGRGIVVQTVGYSAKRISTHAIESEIQSYTRIDDAIGYCYQQEGHAFYVITFPTANKSWAYELATGQWHELAWTDLNGKFNRHRANCCAFAYGKNVIGDWQNGGLLALDPNVFTDNGLPIVRLRTFPHLLQDGDRVNYIQFIVDVQVGTLSSIGGGGSDFNNDFNDDFGPSSQPDVGLPTLSLRWSDDRGVSYGNALTQIMGEGGNYLAQLSFRRLGMARDRVFEVSWSSPIRTALNGAWVETKKSAT